VKLLGVLIRGMTYDGERWRLATVGDWSLEGSHLPQAEQAAQLRQDVSRSVPFVRSKGSSAEDP